jgi:glucose-1-phosphate cytidylyltransferase
MKVVLFCGGFGMRMREYSESIPKPMVRIGYRPILWHIMKYYAHFGHKDFILCLGWKAEVIKDYFLNYDECLRNDFLLPSSCSQMDLLSNDIHEWNVTFVDTGATSNIGQRLKAVEHYLEDDEIFLANYADGLTDFYLPDLIDFFHKQQTIASFLSVKPKNSSFHSVKIGDSGLVQQVQPIEDSDVWMNGGFFVLRKNIFNYIEDGEELVNQPFQRLIADKQLTTMKYDGFWGCMDTFKEKQILDDKYAQGNPPWQVWKTNSKPTYQSIDHDYKKVS